MMRKISPSVCLLTAVVLVGGAVGVACVGAVEFSPVHPTPTAQDLNGVAFADGRFVAVGDGGTLITSVDGLNWLQGETDAFEDLRGVAHGGGQWVAVGSVGAVYTSADGLNWVFRSSGLFLDLHGVTYGDGLFVAVGESSSILTSSDGVVWSREILGGPALRSVTHGGGRFVAVGERFYPGVGGRSFSEGFIVSSRDGVQWTARNSLQCGPLASVTHAGGTFVAAGYSTGTAFTPAHPGPAILTSTDGAEWTGRLWSYESAFSAVAPWAGGFVALKTCCPAELYQSADGLAWARTGPVLTGWVETLAEGGDVAYGHDRLVLIGAAGRIAVSIDGEEIRHVSPEAAGWFPDLVYGNGRFVAVSDGHSLTSTEGVDWVAHDIGAHLNLFSVAAGSGLFVALGGVREPDPLWPGQEISLAGILTSVDGVAWDRQWTNAGMSGHEWRGVRFGNGAFVAISDEGAYRSTDGTNWSELTISNDPDLEFEAIDFGNGVFTLVGFREDHPECVGGEDRDATVLLHSSDGETWAETLFACSRSYLVPASGNGVFLLVGYEGEYFRSLDGENWTVGRLGQEIGFQGATFASGLFVVGSERQLVMTSADGLVWDQHGRGIPPLVMGAAGGGSSLVLLGANYDSGTPELVRAQLVDAAPVVASGPESLTVTPGGAWSFAVKAAGSEPLRYQWSRDGVEIVGATRPVLEFPDVQAGDAGSYVVVVTNAFGQVTSPPAVLAVEAPSAVLAASSGVPEVRLEGPLGKTWRVEYCDQLGGAGPWELLGARHLWRSPIVFETPAPTGVNSRFFRAVMVPR